VKVFHPVELLHGIASTRAVLGEPRITHGSNIDGARFGPSYPFENRNDKNDRSGCRADL
jgi:hypothetical protein